MAYTFPKYSLAKIGAIINSKREEANIDAHVLCKTLGISEGRLAKIETGNAALSFDEMINISKFIGIPVEELTRLEKTNLSDVFYRKTACSDQAAKTLAKAQSIFLELVGQAQLRS